MLGGLSYEEFEKYAEVERKPESLALRLAAATRSVNASTLARRTSWRKTDFMWISQRTTRLTHWRLTPTTSASHSRSSCPSAGSPSSTRTFAQVPHFGGGEDRAGYRAQNDSVGAVEEVECVARSGFLKYSTVGILLEPDLYDPNNQQGWWDDQHWQRGPNNRAKRAAHGPLARPVRRAISNRPQVVRGRRGGLGGIPMIYVQTGFHSQDYAEKFPAHMLFHEPNAPQLDEKGRQAYRDKEKKQPRKMGYDYTDPGFIRHVREVWENLRLAGVQGVKFDYPDLPFTGWPERGGMRDPYATTAMHYRNIFRLAKEGLGPDCYLHERALSRGSDVTLGLVASQLPPRATPTGSIRRWSRATGCAGTRTGSCSTTTWMARTRFMPCPPTATASGRCSPCRTWWAGR